MSFSGSGAEELGSMTVRPPGLQTHTWVSPESSISKVRFLVILHRHLPRRVLFQRCKLQKFYTNIITQLYFVQAEAESMKLYLLTSLQPLPLIGSSAAENNCSHTLCCILELAIIHGQYQGFLLLSSPVPNPQTPKAQPQPCSKTQLVSRRMGLTLKSLLFGFWGGGWWWWPIGF